MPLNLDSCITGIFVPGNIGASSGEPPIIRVMPPRVPETFELQVNEVATAIAVASILGDVGATVIETAAAVDSVYQAQIFDEWVGEVALASDIFFVHAPGVIDADLTEAATAADAVDWSETVEAGFYGVLGIAGPIPPASPAPTIIYIEV